MPIKPDGSWSNKWLLRSFEQNKLIRRFLCHRNASLLPSSPSASFAFCRRWWKFNNPTKLTALCLATRQIRALLRRRQSLVYDLFLCRFFTAPRVWCDDGAGTKKKAQWKEPAILKTASASWNSPSGTLLKPLQSFEAGCKILAQSCSRLDFN